MREQGKLLVLSKNTKHKCELPRHREQEQKLLPLLSGTYYSDLLMIVQYTGRKEYSGFIHASFGGKRVKAVYKLFHGSSGKQSSYIDRYPYTTAGTEIVTSVHAHMHMREYTHKHHYMCPHAVPRQSPWWHGHTEEIVVTLGAKRPTQHKLIGWPLASWLAR